MYKGVAKIYRIYWQAYGGGGALVKSPYLHVAVVLTGLTFNTWTNPEWWDVVISVVPNLLGFTLGGFAIFLGFGDDGFKTSLTLVDENEENHKSAFLQLCAVFVHFIVIQVLALFCALLAKSWWFSAEWTLVLDPYLDILNWIGGAVGFGLFLYALTSVLAATVHVLRIGSMYTTYQKQRRRAALRAIAQQRSQCPDATSAETSLKD